jgi:UDP-2-acetamido-2-deoxy-ribo-hexuluronate aminotransferase
MNHGQFILGPEVDALEERLGEYTGLDVVTCANGTDALVLALISSGVTRGSAVVVPTFTFCATAEAVCMAGCVPVFADVDPMTALMTPTTARAAIDAAHEAGLQLGAIIPVELFGQPVDTSEFVELAQSQGGTVVVDSAQSFGAKLNSQIALRRSVTSTTSFFPSKPLGCYGDGGAVFVNDAQQANLLRSLRVHGQGPSKFQSVRLGMNSRLDTVQAAVLLAKLDVLDEELALRRATAHKYAAALSGLVDFVHEGDRSESAWALFTLFCSRRDETAAKLCNLGIPTGIYYPAPVHRQHAYSSFPAAPDLHAADDLSGKVLSIPMHAYLTDSDVARVVDAVGIAVGL